MSSASTKLRIAVAVAGNGMDPRTQSGVALGTITALSTRADVVALVDTSLTRWQQVVCATTTVSHDRRAWRRRLHRGTWAMRFRTGSLERQLEGVDVDLVLAIRTAYRPLRRPYVPFVDTTLAMARRDWPPMNVWRPPGARRLEGLERLYLAGATHVLTATERAAASVTDDYGVPAARVTAVGGGTNFPPLDTSVAGGTKPVALFVGDDFVRKGGDVLLDAFDRVRLRVPEAELWLIGDHAVPQRPGVRAFGRVSDRNEVARLNRQARVAVLPARFEPFGLVLLEAMSQGVPCVGSRIGAIPDMIADGETGFLVPPRDAEALATALVRLLEDPSLAQTLGTRGLERVRTRFTWDCVADRVVAALESAVSATR